MIEWITALPIWEMIRSLGLISYGAIAVGIMLGIGYSFPVWTPQTKANLYKLHNFMTVGGTILGMLHGVLTVIDQYSPFAWHEILVPFTAASHPVLNGLGTLSGYGMLIVILTTDLRNKLGKKLWKMLHLLSYPTFIMAFVHGYFLGTDTAKPGVGLIYIVSAAAIVSLTALRVMAGSGSKSRNSLTRS